MKPNSPTIALSAAVVGTALAGCSQPRPVTMAPPTAPMMAPPAAVAPMGAPTTPVQSGVNGVYDWRDVPQGQQVPINRAVFDQGGYQLYAASGETIVVPFANQNMYVMKFGRSGGGMYFVNEGQAPTLYIPSNGSLENAAAQGARWYPFSSGYHYERPVYIGLAPTWGDFVGMGWYPGMTYYGGYWGARPWVPGFAYAPMIGLNFNIGGRPYYGWNSYQTYYRSNPGSRVSWGNSRSYNYSSVGRRAPGSSFGRSASGSTGSFGSGRSRSTSGFGASSGRSSFGSSSPSTGTFGSGRSRSTFGSSSGSGFGTGRSTFGAARPSTGTSSFGGGSSGFSGTSRRSSFGSGTSGFGSSGRSSFGGGSSFSSGRSSGSSFSSGRSSSSSFGGGSRSSFGGGRRR